MDLYKIMICDKCDFLSLTFSLDYYHYLILGQERYQQLSFTDGDSE